MIVFCFLLDLQLKNGNKRYIRDIKKFHATHRRRQHHFDDDFPDKAVASSLDWHKLRSIIVA